MARGRNAGTRLQGARISPKQTHRFRNRYTLARTKDNSRDAHVMASALRTDPRCFRLPAVADPVVIELREWSRIAEELSAERNRLKQLSDKTSRLCLTCDACFSF